MHKYSGKKEPFIITVVSMNMLFSDQIRFQDTNRRAQKLVMERERDLMGILLTDIVFVKATRFSHNDVKVLLISINVLCFGQIRDFFKTHERYHR